MIEWVKSKRVSIFFDEIPHLKMRYLLPSTPKDEIISIELYPFICTKGLKVTIFDHKKSKKYIFTIPKGYCWDGCTIPQLLWSIIGISKESNKGIVASCIHDKICENHALINYDRNLSSIILRELFIKGGVSKLKATIMCFFVDIHQKLFCNW